MAEGSVMVGGVPDRIGKYDVLAYLATGGMAEIFLGRAPSGRPVVIKRILPHLARQSGFVTMFIDEARFGSLIRHPNVVEVHELDQVGSDLFMVMEFLEGENTSGLLRRLVHRDERLAYGLAAHVVAEACRGLHAAHQLRDEAGRPLGLVHRDVSPQNVFITYDGDVKVLDFGIATAAYRLSHTATGQLKGKFSYMAPEQCRGEALDARADVFALGVVLFELSMQRRLFARSNELLVLKAVCEEPIPRPSRERPDYPAFLEDICLRALARDRDARYASAQQLHDDLVTARQLLLGTADPRALLAGEMARLFADRRERKRATLQHVRDGGDAGAMPATEVDESVVVPQATQHTPVSSAVAVIEAAPAAPPRRGRRVLAAFGVALAAAAAVVAVPAMREARGRDGSPLPIEGAASAAPVAPTAPAAPAAPAAEPPPVEPTAPPVPAEIVVTIESEPQGARVTVDGEEVGVTPYELRRPSGAPPAALELRHRGYRTLRQTIRADRDQRLVLALRRRAAAKADDGGGRGFHRFD